LAKPKPNALDVLKV